MSEPRTVVGDGIVSVMAGAAASLSLMPENPDKVVRGTVLSMFSLILPGRPTMTYSPFFRPNADSFSFREIAAAMPTDQSALDDLRNEIDRIDDGLRALLGERSNLVSRIAETKKPGLALRPGREARIVRRLVEAGDAGSIPAVVLVRIWREMIASFCRAQGPLDVAVCAPEKSVGYWDIARDHFGSATPMTLHKSPSLVLRAVSEGIASVGIFPLPQDDDVDPWWLHLARTAGPRPQVVGRLPFFVNAGARFEDLEALAIAVLDVDDSGSDIGLFILSTTDPISRASLNTLLEEAGFEGRGLATHIQGENSPERLSLIEGAGLVSAEDERMKAFVGKLDDSNAMIIRVGGYARPIDLS